MGSPKANDGWMSVMRVKATVHLLKLGLREEGGQFVKHVMGVANGHVLPLGFNVCWRGRWTRKAMSTTCLVLLGDDDLDLANLGGCQSVLSSLCVSVDGGCKAVIIGEFTNGMANTMWSTARA